LWRYGFALSPAGNTSDQAVDEAFEKATESSNRHGAVSEEMWALERHVVALVDRLDLVEALKKSQRALRLASSIDNPLAEHAVARMATTCSVLLGMTEQGRQYSIQLRRTARRTRSPLGELNAMVRGSAILDALGEYDALLDEASEVEALIDRSRMSFGGSDYVSLPLAAARALFERGECEAGQQWLDKALDFSEANPGWLTPLIPAI
jgi:tetratricopeptide (TPR) repeat protein